MTTEEKRLQFSIFSLLGGLAFLAFLLAAFIRGNYLLGTRAGILYACVALMVVVVFTRAMKEARVYLLRTGTVVVLAIGVCLGFAFPTYFAPNVQVLMDLQANDRAARRELHAIFAGDSAFSDLSVATTHLKIVNVEVYGTVPTKEDLQCLQQRVHDRCGFVKHCYLHWRIRVQSDSTTYVAENFEEFSDE